MKLYGKEDSRFGDMGDFTGNAIIPLDYNSVVPLLQRKPEKVFSICETSFNILFNIFLKKTTKQDRNCDLLMLMRVKNSTNGRKAAEMGGKILSKMDKGSLVVWAAQEYDMFRFDFYFYTRPKVKTMERPDLLKKLRKSLRKYRTSKPAKPVY